MADDEELRVRCRQGVLVITRDQVRVDPARGARQKRHWAVGRTDIKDIRRKLGKVLVGLVFRTQDGRELLASGMTEAYVTRAIWTLGGGTARALARGATPTAAPRRVQTLATGTAAHRYAPSGGASSQDTGATAHPLYAAKGGAEAPASTRASALLRVLADLRSAGEQVMADPRLRRLIAAGESRLQRLGDWLHRQMVE